MTDLITRLRGLSRHEHDDLTIGDEAADVIERMSAWLEGDCRCPCCDQTRTCVDECTFATDCPNEAERMAGAREALPQRGNVLRSWPSVAPTAGTA